jgi:hypothetical protein
MYRKKGEKEKKENRKEEILRREEKEGRGNP